MTYLPDNRGHEKRGGFDARKFWILILEMDFLAKKMTARDIYFVVRVVQDLFPALFVSVQL